MDIDFSIVLVSLVGVCGILWLFDSLLIRKTRLAAIEESMSGQGKHKGDDEIFYYIKEEEPNI